MKNNVISIIVPVYNSSKYLENSIISIVNQTYKNIEIIVVNDGSTDDSELLIKQLAKSDQRIRYYRISNHGVSYARNYGISKATGDYLMFIDSDDIVDSKICEVLINNLIDTHSDLSVCGYQIIDSQFLLSTTLESKNQVENKKYENLFTIYKGFLWNKLYKKSIIDKYHLKLNETIHMCEDLLFNFEYLKYVLNVVHTDAKLYGYLIASENSSKKINKKWFSILLAYNTLYKNLSDYDLCTQNLLMLNYLFILFETRVRCKILKIPFESVCEHYDVDFKSIKKVYYYKVMKDKKISLTNKLKLFLFYKMFYFAYLIKKNKLLKR